MKKAEKIKEIENQKLYDELYDVSDDVYCEIFAYNNRNAVNNRDCYIL